MFTVLFNAAAVATLAILTVMVPAPVTTCAMVGVPVEVVLPIVAVQALLAVIKLLLITKLAAVDAAVASELVVMTPRCPLQVCGVAPVAEQKAPIDGSATPVGAAPAV